MRPSIAKRRRWNNWLIMGIIAFIAILNAPSLIKTYLLPAPEQSEPATVVGGELTTSQASSEANYPTLLNPNYRLHALFFDGVEIRYQNGTLHSNVNLTDVPLQEFVERWESIEGTEVDQATFDRIRDQLGPAETIEVWYQGVEEPHRITLYKSADFWLLKNWQDKWIAVSVDVDYLIP
ncbi:MAG: hypothetical protein AAGJ67_01360 [Pseudomonadota bacterium]